jgi:arginine deiminase
MPKGLSVYSEIGRLRKVMLHRPGEELLNISPSSLDRLLFDDIPFLEVAQAEHDEFARMLAAEGVEVLYLEDLVADAIKAAPEARGALIDGYIAQCGVHGTMAQGRVRELLEGIGEPRELVDTCMRGIRAGEVELDPSEAHTVSDLRLLERAQRRHMVVDPMPNIYFTRDTFSIVGEGVSQNSMRTETRKRETVFGDVIFRFHPEYAGAPVWFRRTTDRRLEGGDILVLSPEVVAVGLSERTQPSAVDALAQSLLWAPEGAGFSRVLAVSIPKTRSFMHLDTVMTQVDIDAFTVHPNVMDVVECYEVVRGPAKGELRARSLDDPIDHVLARELGLPAVRLIRCGGDDPIASEREQWNDGSNTLAVAPGKVFVYQRNSVTNDIMAKAGLELLEVPSAELSRGRGGPHCMSMAFWRDPVE